MQSRKIVIGIITIFTVLILSACAGANEGENIETESNTEENVESNNDEMVAFLSAYHVHRMGGNNDTPLHPIPQNEFPIYKSHGLIA